MSRYRSLPKAFYGRPAQEVAPDLLGRYLVRRLGGERLVVRVVETEAYLGAPDRASHAWGGRRTGRTAVLFGPAGVAYVYLIYGIHHMLNVVTGEREEGSAVLIRAGEPVEGVERMQGLRGLASGYRPGDLASGPGKLCRAMAIDLGLNQVTLARGPLRLTRGEPVAGSAVAVGPRVGIAYAGEAAGWPLRFAETGNPHVSQPRLERYFR